MIPKKIIIHHSATTDTSTASWPVIRENHIQKGFDDIGYHFGIEYQRGSVEIIVGRFPDKPGAHTKGHNHDSIGICVVGNFMMAAPSEEKWDVLIRLIRFLMKKYGIYSIYGHRELAHDTACPGNFFDMNKLRNDVLMRGVE